MDYFFSISPVHDRYISIRTVIPNRNKQDVIEVCLPAWRPGRYELGNFAKNIKGFSASDPDLNALVSEKTDKSTWRIHAHGKDVQLHYKYYCSQWDAGACWLDHDQLYINPVHCCFYVRDQLSEPCKVHIALPEGWKTASGMLKKSDAELHASDFHELADSPFICSPSIQHGSYTVNGIPFHIWFQGECHPDWNRILKDFEGFTKLQIDTMGGFPAREFHFLVQITPHTFYHGVEHLTSTVLALGPGHKLMSKELYNDLLGVASHELFHCWNVKSIRPAEMLPYSYSGENYASSGYVYEGAATYYGDLFLGRSGFFTFQDMLDEFSARLQKHMDNPGRYNYSVAESSFDTWLDGYVPGAPGRKVSIYDEGCLISLILDFMIRSATAGSKSLDDVMRALYHDFALKGKGYGPADYQQLCERIAGRSFEDFFQGFVNKASSLEGLLSEVLSLAGLELNITQAATSQENHFGIRTENRGGNTFITSVYPGSPAHQAGLLKDDEIVFVNGIRVENNIHDLCSYFGEGEPEWVIASSKKLRKVTLKTGVKKFYQKYKIIPTEKLTESQLQFRNGWAGNIR